VLPITLLLPIRDGSRYVERIISQMQANAEMEDELLVIDDGSTDETPEILAKLKIDSNQIRVIRTVGIGLVSALNLGFKESKNNWIARFDADDQYPENRLSVQRKMIADNVSVIFSDYTIRLNGEKFAGIIPSPIFHEAIALSLLFSQQTAHPSALINKKHFLRVGGYLEREFPAEDLGLWMRMSVQGNLVSVPDNLLFYNLSHGSISAVRRKEVVVKTKYLVSRYIPELEKILLASQKPDLGFHSYKGLNLRRQREILFLRSLRKFYRLHHDKNTSIGIKLPNFYLCVSLHPMVMTSMLHFSRIRRNFRIS